MNSYFFTVRSIFRSGETQLVLQRARASAICVLFQEEQSISYNDSRLQEVKLKLKIKIEI